MSTNVCAKFRCAPQHIEKALRIFRELVPHFFESSYENPRKISVLEKNIWNKANSENILEKVLGKYLRKH